MIGEKVGETMNKVMALPIRAARYSISQIGAGPYVAAIFLSAALVFLVQPMFAKMATPLLGGAPILICNIDAIWLEFASVLGGLMATWDGGAMDDLLLLAPTGSALGYNGKGDFDMDSNKRLTRRSGDTADYVYAGVQIFKPEMAAGYPTEKFSRNKMWDETLKTKRLCGYPLPGFWMHAGDPQAVKYTEAVLSEARRLG